MKKTATANQLLVNLLNAIKSASQKNNVGDQNTDEQPPTKRLKKDDADTSEQSNESDIYCILDPSFAKGKDIVHLPGAIISRLTVGGLINALAGVSGGLVDPIHSEQISNAYTSDQPIPTAGNLTLKSIKNVYTRALHRALSARLEIDMMNSTPARIAELLCPEVTLADVNNIRKRIYETVILGKGTHASDRAAGLEGTEDLPVAARVGMHDIDKWKKCKVCNNNDQSSFVLDRKNGDLICTNCGTVATESLMHEGSQFRKFEGELDRNHHGDTPNPLYSNAHNMSTTLGGVSVQTGAGMGGFGSGKKQNLENILRNVHDYTEMNISQFGKDEKKTRVGYKDRQKKDAFVKMTHAGDALSLHEAVVQRAKELFAGFRDDRELVQQFKGVVAACLCEAFDQLSKEGKQILKLSTGEEEWETNEGGDKLKSDESDSFDKFNKRASKRSEMHSSNMAGKGGLFLNAPAKVIEEQERQKKSIAANANGASAPLPSSLNETKPASSWDLDDCRSWLLEASRSIAKQWSDQQQDEKNQSASMNLPKGNLSELEGKLVEHTLELCGMLESQLNSTAKKGGLSRQRVITPRVREMGRLGIKWQHAHERGSGGAGGVGNNAMSAKNNSKGVKIGSRGSRTAGQILILMTSTKLSDAIKDPIAGAAFHKELRAVLSRQGDRKKKDLRDEAAFQRFRQMQRKPWLKARLEEMT